MPFSGQDVVNVFQRLEKGGVPAWVDGGWGVDALLKKQTREHQDLDLMIPLECLAAAEDILGAIGFSKDDNETDLPTRVVFKNQNGLEIDVHPVTFSQNGSAIHIDVDKEGRRYAYVCSASGLSGVGLIDGRVVRCTTAAEQIHQKVKRRYSPWSQSRTRGNGVSADLEDIISLLQLFGVEDGQLTYEAVAFQPQLLDSPAVKEASQFCLRHVASLNTQHSQLRAQHAEIEAQHSQLRAEHAELAAQYSQLRAEHGKLKARYSQLAAVRANLTAQCAALSARLKLRKSPVRRLAAEIRRGAKRIGVV